MTILARLILRALDALDARVCRLSEECVLL